MRRLAAAFTGAAVLAGTAALGGCGFHLQGRAPLPPALAAPYLQTADRYSEFYQSLAEGLTTSGARLTRTAAGASAVLEVQSDESGQRVLSVSARNTPREYQVWYTVTYRVRVGERELAAPQTLTLTRDYSFVETAVLAKEHEREIIRSALARDLAALVMRQLAALPP